MTESNNTEVQHPSSVQDATSKPATIRLDDLYLKIVKIAMISVMSLALISIIILLPLAAINYFQTPATPPAIQKAPEKQINFDEFKNLLIENQKKAVQKMEQEKLRADGKLSANAVPASEIIFDKPFESLIIPMYSCIGAFAKTTNPNMDEPDVVRDRENLRAEIVQISKQPFKGEAWIQSVALFACQVLKDPTIVQLTKDKQIGAVVAPLVSFHGRAWVAIQKEKIAFEENQQRQFDMFTAREAVRVAKAKVEAVFMATAAGIAFLLFVLLALYLIFAKIETNLALISRGVDAVNANKSN